MAVYIIGDIQGCYDELQKLLDVIRPDFKTDALWFVGDLVNRGPDSLKVMRFLKNLSPNTIITLGNHDLHLLAVFYANAPLKSGDTLQEILNAPDIKELLDWLCNQKLAHYDVSLNCLMTHAGVPPAWDLETTLSCAHEIELLLQDKIQRRWLLSQLYGNKPDVWNPKLQGIDRYRYIINALTRLRYCDNEGRLDLECKVAPSQAPKNLTPWFEFPNRKLANIDIAFGHWASLMGKIKTPHIYAIDTGCYWGGSLTAIRLEDKKRFSVAKI